MSDNNFSVPVKKPLEKKSTTKKSSTDKVQKNQKGGTKPKPKQPVKKSEKPALESIPDMGLLSSTERHNLILGKSVVQQNGVKKAERSVNLDTIKKAQVKQKANEEIPKLGARKAVKRSPIELLVAVLIILLIIFILAFAISFSKKSKTDEVIITPTLKLKDELILNIEQGMSAYQVATQLSPLFDEKAFLDELTKRNLASSIQIGKYKISSDNTIDEIILAITNKQNYIKIYDGQDIASIDRMLANKGLIANGDFIAECNILKEDENLPFVEGWLLSGSFIEHKVDTATKLAHEMHSALLEYIKVHSEEFNRSEYSINELLIIASMIQRETQDEAQMPLIASVIFNRLKCDMPLGIDATTRYEIDDWKNEIPQKVYDEITPYNTRRKKGLPPTGIGCVSEKALDAALNPANTDYLYYRHGSDGKLYLSHTYDEHLALAPVAK